MTDPAKETQEVKDVTQGVEEVDLSGTSKDSAEAVAPESIPLPADMGDNLDDGNGTSDTQETEGAMLVPEDAVPIVEEKDDKAADEVEKTVVEVQKGVQGTPKKVQEESVAAPDVVEESSEDIPKTSSA